MHLPKGERPCHALAALGSFETDTVFDSAQDLARPCRALEELEDGQDN